MDNKQFDEIMKKYVQGTAKGMDADFAKLREKPATSQKRRWSKPLTAFISMALVVAVTLAIALPLTLNKGSTPSNGASDGSSIEQVPPNDGYSEEVSVIPVQVADVKELKDTYGYDVFMPTISCFNYYISVLQTQTATPRTVCAFLELTILDEIFLDAKVYVIKNPDKPYILKHFESLPFDTVWGELNVKYYVATEVFEGTNFYKASVYFELDGYKYCLTTNYVQELEIPAMLDLLF